MPDAPRGPLLKRGKKERRIIVLIMIVLLIQEKELALVLIPAEVHRISDLEKSEDREIYVMGRSRILVQSGDVVVVHVEQCVDLEGVVQACLHFGGAPP